MPNIQALVVAGGGGGGWLSGGGGGAGGSFQYVVLYDDTATNKEVIGFYDYRSAVTLANGDTFVVGFDVTNGVIAIA